MKFLFISLLFLATHASSQDYINLNKTKARKTFQKYADNKKYQTVIQETDSTLTLLLRDPKVQNLDIYVHFDQRGKCDRELQTFSCDSCYRKQLDTLLSSKYYKWIKVSTNTYFSKSRSGLILSPIADRPFTFLVQRSRLPGGEYREMIKKASNN